MYQEKDLEKSFKKITDFFEIEVELAQVSNIDKEIFVFYLKKTKNEVDIKKIKTALEDQLRIKAEIRFLSGREEAQQIGGCGPCGKKLCCASWLKNIPSVSSECLKGKDFSDPTEYLGMCGELKCCLAFTDKNFKLPKQLYKTKVEPPKKEEKKPEHKKTPITVPKKRMVRKLTLKKKGRK